MGQKRVEIVWTDPAKRDLQDIFDFLTHKVSLSIAENQIIRIIKRVDLLEDGFTQIGQREPLLLKKKFEYRYLVQDKYKIIYHQKKSRVIIDMVFDTRKYPGKMNPDNA